LFLAKGGHFFSFVSQALNDHTADLRSAEKSWVALDKSEGVVKIHFFAAMLSRTAWFSEWWRTEALKLSR
jgi:hypothetical protein